LSLELDCPELPKRSWAKISQVRTLSVERLGERLGAASAEDLQEVVAGLSEIVGA
jgi:mRNA interferase MazF